MTNEQVAAICGTIIAAVALRMYGRHISIEKEFLSWFDFVMRMLNGKKEN